MWFRGAKLESGQMPLHMRRLLSHMAARRAQLREGRFCLWRAPDGVRPTDLDLCLAGVGSVHKEDLDLLERAVGVIAEVPESASWRPVASLYFRGDALEQDWQRVVGSGAVLAG